MPIWRSIAAFYVDFVTRKLFFKLPKLVCTYISSRTVELLCQNFQTCQEKFQFTSRGTSVQESSVEMVGEVVEDILETFFILMF